MSSNPHGIRYSSFNKNNVTSVMQQQQQQQNMKQVPVMMRVPPKPKQYLHTMQQQQMDQNLSGSDTDVSTSNENLSKEERYVIKHMARVEPQGQENLQGGKTTPVGDASQGKSFPFQD